MTEEADENVTSLTKADRSDAKRCGARFALEAAARRAEKADAVVEAARNLASYGTLPRRCGLCHRAIGDCDFESKNEEAGPCARRE